MASAIKSKLAKAVGTSSSDPLSSQEAEKYKLMVTAGPSYDQSTHRTVRVNSSEATYVENEFLRAQIKVRIRQYHGLPTSSPPNSPYFDHSLHDKDQYSIAFSFVPKVDLPSEGTVWGNDFDHPVRDRLPPGFNTAFKIVKEFIDPGLQCDAYADQPWLYGPSLSCWFAFRVGDKVNEGQDFPAPSDKEVMVDGGDGSGAEIRQELNIPEDNEKRRKHFLSAAHRERFIFEKGRLYQADFYNPYIDFGNFALKLPGFSLKVIKYVDQKSHCLRYVFKRRDTGDMYLNINFHLLWGEKLQAAMKNDEERGETGLDGVTETEGSPASKDHNMAAGNAKEENRTASQPQNIEQERVESTANESQPTAPATPSPPAQETAQHNPSPEDVDPPVQPGSAGSPPRSSLTPQTKQRPSVDPESSMNNFPTALHTEVASTNEAAQPNHKDHTAAAGYLAGWTRAVSSSGGTTADDVKDIADLLQDTSTDDKSGSARVYALQ